MFLSKFLNRVSGALGIKWQLVIVELVIVFASVYSAFYLNNYQESKYIKQESEKIWSSLKIELEGIRLGFPIWAEYQAEQNIKWDTLLANEQIGKFYDWRYIQPQYDFTTIQYAIDSREGSIVDFDMYKRLTALHQNIQQLEHVETLMTEIGLKYRNGSRSLPKENTEYKLLFAENKFLFYKFLDFSKIRVGNLRRIAQASEGLLTIIDEKLGSKRKIELEKKYIQDQIVRLDKKAKKEEILQRIKSNFPNYSDEILENIYILAQKEIEEKSL